MHRAIVRRTPPGSKLLSFFDTYWSIGFIAAVQLYYAFAPFQRLARRDRNG
jgi:hypothetical protein